MIIGVPKEILNNEFRVSLTPAGANALKKADHRIIVQKGAGLGSGILDSDYVLAGAEIDPSPEFIYKESDLILKVKEPLEEEYPLIQNGKILFTYLHLAPNTALIKQLLEKNITSIGYETVQLSNGSLPLLAPMSEVAGRMSVQIGANLLQKTNGGSGMLLGGVPGVPAAKVVVAGGGIAGFNAARMAMGIGANVTVLDIKKDRLDSIDQLTNGRISTLYSNEYNMSEALKQADLLISTVLIAGAKAPKIVTEEMVKSMNKGSVIVDIAIDQGGSVETIDHSTTHEKPTFEKYGVTHYAVPNIPGAVPKTSTYALTGATLSYIIKIASMGINNALLSDPALLRGLNTHKGQLTCKGVAEAQNMPYTEGELLLSH